MLWTQWALYLALAGSSAAVSSGQKNEHLELAACMIESNVHRGQGLKSTGKVSTYIELGVFQQALRAAIDTTKDSDQAAKWKQYLNTSTYASVPLLQDSDKDAQLPLDRFSTGTSIILSQLSDPNPILDNTTTTLEDSLVSQPRNANSGLWYFANPSNLPSYRNLSYLDGMYSYPKFASLLNSSYLGDDILQQLNILYNTCRHPTTGLLVHGYDALKSHNWSDPTTGASPIVWGRALAWYTAGIVTTLQTPHLELSVSIRLKELFRNVLAPQIKAIEASLKKTGQAGVWQVVDRPGERGNFIEASASFLTSWALLASAREGFIEGEALRASAVKAGREVYESAKGLFLVPGSDLGINGTSAVASLGSAVDVDYDYYITRPTELNSLFGTSGFILASLEMAQLAETQ